MKKIIDKLLGEDPEIDLLRVENEQYLEELTELKHKYNDLVDTCNMYADMARGHGKIIKVKDGNKKPTKVTVTAKKKKKPTKKK